MDIPKTDICFYCHDRFQKLTLQITNVGYIYVVSLQHIRIILMELPVNDHGGSLIQSIVCMISK